MAEIDEVDLSRELPTLKYIAIVSIVQALWRKSILSEQLWVQEYVNKFNVNTSKERIGYMINNLMIVIDQLSLPNILKIDVYGKMITMVEEFVDWLNKRKGPEQYTFWRKQESLVKNEIERHLVNNIVWKNSGCIDGAAMWKSYIDSGADICDHDIRFYLFEWPGISFLDDWICAIETIEHEDCFYEIFGFLAIDSTRINRTFYSNTRYKSCAKIWRMFYRKFSENDFVLYKVFSIFFSMHNCDLCCMMFEGMDDNQRKTLIRKLGNATNTTMKRDIEYHGPFLPIFSERVLQDNEERLMFLDIWRRMGIV